MIPKRKSMRLPDYDYSQNGYYFITICTKNMQCLLSSVVGADDLSRVTYFTKCVNTYFTLFCI